MKQVQISMMVDEDVKTKFQSLCKKSDIPVSRAIRLFMQHCINKGYVINEAVK